MKLNRSFSEILRHKLYVKQLLHIFYCIYSNYFSKCDNFKLEQSCKGAAFITNQRCTKFCYYAFLSFHLIGRSSTKKKYSWKYFQFPIMLPMNKDEYQYPFFLSFFHTLYNHYLINVDKTCAKIFPEINKPQWLTTTIEK